MQQTLRSIFHTFKFYSSNTLSTEITNLRHRLSDLNTCPAVQRQTEVFPVLEEFDLNMGSEVREKISQLEEIFGKRKDFFMLLEI